MSSMLTITDSIKYHLYRKETDMRKSFNALSGIVKNELGKNIMTEDAFIFTTWWFREKFSHEIALLQQYLL